MNRTLPRISFILFDLIKSWHIKKLIAQYVVSIKVIEEEAYHMHRKKHNSIAILYLPLFSLTKSKHTLSVCGIRDSTLAFNASSIGPILLAKYSSKLKSVVVDWNKFVVDLMEVGDVGDVGTKLVAFCIDNASNAAFISVDVVIIKGLVVLCRCLFPLLLVRWLLYLNM